MESDKAQAQALLMFNCVHQGHFNVLRKLLKAGANPNVFDAEGEPLIFIPVVNGDYETLEVLLESGKYILIQASHKPDPFSLVLFCKSLIEYFAAFTQTSNKTFLETILISSYCFADVCDINIKSLDSSTSALTTAVGLDDLEMVKFLIKTGADVNCIDESGKTPLLLALQDGKFKIAQYLMKQGSDVNIVDGLGQSALFLIANGGNFDCLKTVKKLLKSGKSSFNFLLTFEF